MYLSELADVGRAACVCVAWHRVFSGNTVWRAVAQVHGVAVPSAVEDARAFFLQRPITVHIVRVEDSFTARRILSRHSVCVTPLMTVGQLQALVLKQNVGMIDEASTLEPHVPSTVDPLASDHANCTWPDFSGTIHGAQEESRLQKQLLYHYVDNGSVLELRLRVMVAMD